MTDEFKEVLIPEDIDRGELFGTMDKNLDLIQEAASVEIFQRDDRLLIRGEDVHLAEEILNEIIEVLQSGEKIDAQKIGYIIQLKEKGMSYKESGISKNIVCFTTRGKPIKPKTLGQKG